MDDSQLLFTLPVEEETEEQINQCKYDICESMLSAGKEEMLRKEMDWHLKNYPRPNYRDLGSTDWEAYIKAAKLADKELERLRNGWYSELGKKTQKAMQRATTLSWGKIRKLVWERDKGTCQVCGNEIEWKHYECGHIIDRVAGGSDRLSNLVVMCIPCNQGKPPTETREKYIEWAAKRLTVLESLFSRS